ncbi:LysM peptidoglycan-binding domain-containing protein [Micromonospora sp. LZ34]
MRTRATSAATAVACTLLLAVAPAVLIHLAAWPDPEGSWTVALRDWVRQPLTTGFLAGLTYVAAWTIWALLATAVAARAYTRVNRVLRWLPALHLPGPLRSLTAALLGATAVSATAGAMPAHASAPTDTTSADAAELSRVAPAITPAGRTAAASQPGGERDDTYTVRRGDTLSDIAQRCLGDPDRWPEIFAANRGTHFPHTGGTLRDPDLIYPGWTLHLPTHAQASNSDAPPSKQKAPPTQPGPRKPQPGLDTTAAPAHPTPATGTPDSRPPASPTDTGGGIASPTTTAPGPAAVTTRDTPDEEHRPRGVTLPTGSWVDIGLALAVAAAVALVWAHRRHRYTPRQPPARPHLDHSGPAPMPRVVNQIRRALRPETEHPPTPDQNVCRPATPNDTEAPRHTTVRALGPQTTPVRADRRRWCPRWNGRCRCRGRPPGWL